MGGGGNSHMIVGREIISYWIHGRRLLETGRSVLERHGRKAFW
jgi:hypothetical protein